MALIEYLLRSYFLSRSRELERRLRRPVETQRRQLEYLLQAGRRTRFGAEHGLEGVHTPEQFARQVPLTDYDAFRGYVERALAGERDVTWPGRVRWFARSSGTTSGRSKYIPVTDDSLRRNHKRGLMDVAALYARNHPASHVFAGKTLTLGGSYAPQGAARAGDLSSILVATNGFWSGWFRAPRRETALIASFDEKVERICRECAAEPVTAFAGVPSWNLALMRRMLEFTGRRDLREVWPGLELFVHGGVGFAPYREAFRELIPGEGMHYMETYNASEGFFAIADDPAHAEEMLLLPDYGCYYEFRRGDEVVPLEGVRCGEEYALLITSCNGLWRYEVGDVVRFTSTDPYRLRVAGRTRQFINAFGEELMVSNTDRAVAEAAAATGAVVGEYTAAPRYMTLAEAGCHEWWVEFAREPADRDAFARALDEALRRLNSDYDAKRLSTMGPLRLHEVPAGSFTAWMTATGRNKVPRLSNDRRTAEAFAAWLESNERK